MQWWRVMETEGGRKREPFSFGRVFEASLVGMGQYWFCHSSSPAANLLRATPSSALPERLTH